MFLVIKKGLDILALDAAEATIATMYASVKEEYNDLDVDIQFMEPNCEIVCNLINFIRKIDIMIYGGQEITKENQVEEECLEFIESEIDLDDDVLTFEEIEEEGITKEEILEEGILSLELNEESEREYSVEAIQTPEIKIEIEEEPEIIEEKIEETLMEELSPKIEERKAKASPADRMMEALKEEQKNAGLPQLEDDKINTLAYKDYLLNYMKMGFACNILKKKAKECKDVAEQARYNAFCEAVDTRTEDYEITFKEIGLTSGQVHTFRMEVLREVKKYSDDSIREIYEYLNKLYQLSTKLINEIK